MQHAACLLLSPPSDASLAAALRECAERVVADCAPLAQAGSRPTLVELASCAVHGGAVVAEDGDARSLLLRGMATEVVRLAELSGSDLDDFEGVSQLVVVALAREAEAFGLRVRASAEERGLESAASATNGGAAVLPLVLVFDKELQALPWECVPLLRGRPVSRMPSLSFVLDGIAQRRDDQRAPVKAAAAQRRASGFFVIDPARDLTSTRETVGGWVRKSLPMWEGALGEAPSPDAVRSALCTRKVYLYCGHGGGEAYLKGDTVQQLDCRAVALLMGCSSGVLRGAGALEPHGVPLDYLIAGCPAVVANLWDVTGEWCFFVMRWGRRACPGGRAVGRGEGRRALVACSLTPAPSCCISVGCGCCRQGH